MRSIFITSLLLSTILFKSEGQIFTVYNYSVAEGLPSSEVYEVHQDRKGFLWIATDNGVVKFDGSQMTTYHTKDGLSDPVVFGFQEDSKNRLWFRTYSGRLSYYENGKIIQYPYNDKLTTLNVPGLLNFTVSDKNELWFTLRNILGKIDSNGNVTLDSIKNKSIYYKDIDSTFITGSYDRHALPSVVTINGKTFPINITKTTFENRIFRFLQWRNKLYFSASNEIFLFDGTSVSKVLSGSNPVISLSKDREDHLWIGYLNGGVDRYSAEGFRKSLSPESLKGKSVTSVAQDHEGGFWFSTLENGVFHIPNLLIAHFPTTSSRIRGVINLKNDIVIGDYAGNITAIDGNKKHQLWRKSVSNPISSMFTNNNKIWVSANDIRIYNTQFALEKSYPGVANNYFEDTDGSVWAIGSTLLRKFDKNGTQLNKSRTNILSRALHIDKSGIYVADRTGMKVLNSALEIIDEPKAFNDLKITHIQKLNDSTLLVTTTGRGFILLNQKTREYKIYNADNNFLADNIYSSLVTDSTLWLGSEKGLIKIPIAQLGRKKFSVEYLTKKSGLINDKIDFIVPVNDEIWAFTDNYFSVVPANFSKFASRKPIYYTREIKINEQTVNLVNNLVLDNKQNNLEVSFGFISFNNANVLLRYRLSDHHSWSYTNNKKLIFSSLAPGSYLFDLQYSTDNIHWDSANPALTFSIAKPWWGEWYTFVSALLIFFLLGYFYFLYQKSIYNQKNHYLKIINEHQQKLIQSEILTRERERNRISKELHDRVGTNLTAIKLTVSQLLKTHHDPMADDVEEQFQMAIKEIKDIIYGLTPPGLERYGLFTGLKNYLARLKRSLPVNISLKTFGEDNHSYDLNITVFRVIQELLSNTIKHSFAKNITIHINSFEDMLNIMYEDDGIGFNHNPELSGLGLDNIESRIQSVNGTLKFDSGKFGISYTIDIPVTLNKETA